MRVLHVVAGLPAQSGGPSRTVVQLTDHLAQDEELRIELLSGSLSGETQMASMLGTRVVRKILNTGNPLAYRLGWPVYKELREHKNSLPNIVHNHGLWLPVNHWATSFARKNKLPLITHTRGMLQPWALNYRGWKKKFVMALYQRHDLECASVLIATGQHEAEAIRAMGLRVPVAVIPNGVELPDAHVPEARRNAENSKRRLLFLGRIHPVKGLVNLLEAWARLRPQGWVLQIAGPDEGGHRSVLVSRVRALGIEEKVEFVGAVDGEEKADLYQKADLFVLPSFTENFGLVVAEALAYGVPVITTTGTPWQGLQSHGCGWLVDPSVNGLTGALRQATSMNKEALHDMGMKGGEYARDFDWTHIAQQTAEVYRWALGQGHRPDCVLES